MEITPATLHQVRQGSDGKFVQIEQDVANVVADLQAIDANFRVRYSEAGGYFVVYVIVHNDVTGEDSEHLVLTAQELDQRIVRRVREIMRWDYDYAAELDAQDAKAQAAADHRLHEQVGEIGERLFHAARKDKGVT